MANPLLTALQYGVGALGLIDTKNAQKDYDAAVTRRESQIRDIFTGLISRADELERKATGAERSSLRETAQRLRQQLKDLGDPLVREQSALGRMIDQQATADITGLTAGYGAREGAVLGDVGTTEGDVLGTLRERYDKAVADLVGSGDQEMKDIATRFDQSKEADRAELSTRGLGMSTLLEASDQANERDRGNELGRLKERIRQEKLNVDVNLLGDIASAKERFGLIRAGYRAGLSGDTLMAGERGAASRLGYRAGFGEAGLDLRERLGLNRLQMEAGLGNAQLQMLANQAARRLGIATTIPQNYANFIENIVDVPPQNNWPAYFASLAQANAAANAPTPSSSSAYGPAAISAGGSIGGAVVLGTILAAGFCIEADTMLDTPTGRTSLRDVKVGDFVLNSDGDAKMVKAKHLGIAPPALRDGFRRLTIRVSGVSRSIVGSFDHVVGGKRIDDWEKDPLVRVEPCEAREAGDILLEDGSDYMANELPVSSMIRDQDIPNLERLEPHNQRRALAVGA